jgi:hypothetical protein
MKSRKSFTSIALIIILIAITMSNCKTPKERAGRSRTTKIAVEDFDSFYNRFHTDSLFQISRVLFPLEGGSVDGLEEKKWTKENWQMVKTKVFDIDTTLFRVSYKKTENKFSAKAWIEDSGFSTEFRFELINKKWYLVYASDQNL